MEEQRPCCQEIRKPTPSPFEIARLGWYDGVTEGLARCKACGTTYTFDAICSSTGGVRVYGFARVVEAYYRAVVSALDRPPPAYDRLQEWREELALVEARLPKGQAERDLLVVARDLEEEVILGRRVTFASLCEFLERVG